MSWNKSTFSQEKTKSSDNLISLYSRIPDYSQVKHLSQSDFINALEQLKEDFRQCRANLYSEDLKSESSSSSDDVDKITERTSKVLNIHSSFGHGGKFSKVTNTNLDPFFQSGNKNKGESLSVKGCELHRNPFASSGGATTNYVNYNKPSRSLSFNLREDSSNYQNRFLNYEGGDGLESGSDTPDSDFSKWSSSPDLYSTRPFIPPSNVQKRLLQRKTENNSAPSLIVPEEESTTVFKANPVPSHVYKPLYEFIMLKNQRRSQKVREQSKQKLMAQVKPFSFARETKSSNHGLNKPINHEKSTNCNNKEQLNNAKPVKAKRSCGSGSAPSFKTINYFRANPAPPRTKALLSAMRLKEQQEYRELKKRLRAEALLKNATLPPSMAARDKRLKINNAKLDALIQEYQNTYNSAKDNENASRNYREQSADDTTGYTDEDRLSEDSGQEDSQPNGARLLALKKIKNFTPYGKSRHSSAASGVFECTSNDNLASRLRIQATRKRECERMKREEEELLKLMRNENRRKKLRDSHINAWRRAHSYSSTQDIAMRRQLRMAASILERESFVRDMSSMLTRVRSAPLLLEGLRERRSEPCKQHREEFLQLGDRSNNKKSTTPRSSRNEGGRSNWIYDRYAEEPSETAALAEGNLTDSDNHSLGNIDFDSEHEQQQQHSQTTSNPSSLKRNKAKRDNAKSENNQNQSQTQNIKETL